MKTCRILPLVLFFFSVLITSCSEKEEDILLWDFAPIEISVDIQNDKGESLLRPESEGSIFNTDAITLIYDGKESTPFWTLEDRYHYMESNMSRHYLARFYGIYYETFYSGRPILNVGEWDGACNFEESFTLLHNGKSEAFRVVNKVTWKKNNPNVTTTVYLNGKKIDEHPIIIKY